jgi:hypothetical protein
VDQANTLDSDQKRKRLSNRRGHELVEFEHGGFRYTAGLGRFDGGRLAEIFLTTARSGTAIETAARDSAILLSLLLQHGGPIDMARHAVTRNEDGSASGPVGALLDLLAATGSAS